MTLPLPPREESIDLLALLQKHRLALLSLVSLSILTAVGALHTIPKLYKSKAVISIQPSYFQNPLAMGTDTHEVLELKNQRELMLKKALSNEFLEELDEKYHLSYRATSRVESKVGPLPARSAEEQDRLRKRFELYFVNSMTFQLSFIASQPDSAYVVVQASTRRILSFLEESRRQMILATQKAIEADLDAMDPPPEPLAQQSQRQLNDRTAETHETTVASNDIHFYKREVSQLESRVRLLSLVYSPTHPELRHLKSRLKALKSWMTASEPELPTKPNHDETTPGLGKITRSNSNIYEDLLRKWHYLNVALSVEHQKDNPQLLVIEAPSIYREPVWPKFDTLATWCLGGGLVIFVFWVILMEWVEHRKRSEL